MPYAALDSIVNEAVISLKRLFVLRKKAKDIYGISKIAAAFLVEGRAYA